MIEAQSQEIPLISVVIPTWNAASFVDRVLLTLELQSDQNFEVLIIDNGKTNEETEVVARAFQKKGMLVRYFGYTELLGYAGAVNEGARKAGSDLIAVFNNDNLADPDWLLALRAAYKVAQSEGVEAIVTSLVDRPDFSEPLLHCTNFWFRIVRPPGFFQTQREVFHPDGSAFLFNRRFFGVPYDSDYFVYQEDVALGWHAWLWGAEVRLVPESRAKTFDGGSTRRIKHRTAFYTERNRWWNYLIFLSRASLLRAAPALLVDFGIRLIFGRNRVAKAMAVCAVCARLPLILEKRHRMQHGRKNSDEKILSMLSAQYLIGNHGLRAFVNGFFSNLLKCFGLPIGR